MQRRINKGAYKIYFDESNLRFFVTNSRSAWAFSTETLKALTKLSDIASPNQVYTSHENGVIAVKNTVGEFAFYDVSDFSFRGKLKIRTCKNTGADFCFSEEENVICGIMETAYGQSLYRIYLDTLEYVTLPLEQLKRDSVVEGETPVTRYELRKYSQGNFYMIRNFYNVGSYGAQIYDCSYGRYVLEDNKLILKERYLEGSGCLDLLDLTENEAYRKALALTCSKHLDGRFIKLYRKGSELFLITSKAVYRQTPDGGYEKIFSDDYCSDYAEFNGKRFFCTWNYFIVEDDEVQDQRLA